MTDSSLRVGIDIHAIGSRQTGNETYVRNLVEQLILLQEPALDLGLYHTHPDAAPQWRDRCRRVWPAPASLRIPLGFPAVLARDRIDVAHFQYVMPPLCPCPAVVMIHDISYEFHPEYFHPLARRRMQLLIPLSARRSARVLTVSEFSKRQIVERYRIPEEKITVTHNGVAPHFRALTDADRLATTLRRQGLRRPYILAVGNLQPRKNLERLVRVYASLRKRELIEQELVLVGQLHWKGSAVLAAIEASGCAEQVRVTGYVDEEDLVALYNGADLFAYPSLYEGFGLPVIEAMACGTPVITSRTASLPEIAGDAAVLVDPGSDGELEAALLRLCGDAEQRRELRERGLARSRLFDWKRGAEQTLAVFKRAVAA